MGNRTAFKTPDRPEEINATGEKESENKPRKNGQGFNRVDGKIGGELMATISEMFVEIGADASEFQREAQRMQTQMSGLGNDMRNMAASMGTSTAQMSRNFRDMSSEMREAYRAQTESMRPFREQQREVEFGFFNMARGMQNYQGTTREFMGELLEMGNTQRRVNDSMMAADRMRLTGFIQGVATMLARSAASDKIAANFRRMGNPLYTVNNGLLRVSAGLEGIARRGTPAVLALEMLGPTANMKQLADMTRLITQGLMRFTSVALAATIVNVMMFSALHKAAMDSVPGYKAALEEMTAAVRKAFQPMVDVFGAVMTKIYNLITWVANLAIAFNEAHPFLAKVIQGFLMLIPLLTLILSPLAVGIGLFMGMRAAFAAVWMLIGPLVTGLAAMMGTVLIVAAAIAILVAVLVLLWKKNEAFRDGVISIWNSIKTAAIAIWMMIYEQGIKPAIAAIVTFVNDQMEKVRAFWAQNGEQIKQAASNVWNVIKAVINVVMIAIMAIMAVLWPVIKNLIVSTWNAIKNVISGAIDVILGVIKFFSALFTGDWKGLWEATKQILSGAVQLIWGLINLWFVGKMIGGLKAFAAAGRALFTSFWAAIKGMFTGAVTSVGNTVRSGFTFVQTIITTIFNGIRSFITTILNAVRALFTGNFSAIGQIVTTYANLIRSVITTALNVAKSVISTVLSAIKALFTGNWSAIGSIVKSGASNVVNIIKSGLNNAINFIKSLGATFKAAGKGLIDMMAAGIANAAGKVISKVKELAGKVRDMLPFSPAKDGPLSDLDRLDFGGPIADSLKRGMPTVQRLMHDMVTMPDIMAPSMPTYSAQALSKEKATQQVIVELDGRVLARGVLPSMEREIRLKTGLKFN